MDVVARVPRGEHGDRGTPLPVGVAAFVAIGIAGVAGCLLGGWLGDRVGRARLAALAMAVSGTCCIAAAFAFGGPPSSSCRWCSCGAQR